MARPTAKQLLSGLKQTLGRQKLDYERIVIEFGQVPASESRERGEHFPLPKHVRGLLLAQLSNQRPWGPIAANLPRIEKVFCDFDPDKLEAADAGELAQAIIAIRCGNRRIAKQLALLSKNIGTFRLIESEYGSMDKFVISADPNAIARQLSGPGRFKLREVGYTLALEYLRNVGIRAAKPDMHVRRVLSAGRLAYAAGNPSEEEAYRIVGVLAVEAECNPTYLDNLLWLFCAQDYGNICRAEPRCAVCEFRSTCNFPTSETRAAETAAS